jgi:hypothetical protein
MPSERACAGSKSCRIEPLLLACGVSARDLNLQSPSTTVNCSDYSWLV